MEKNLSINYIMSRLKSVPGRDMVCHGDDDMWFQFVISFLTVLVPISRAEGVVADWSVGPGLGQEYDYP